NCNNQQDEGLTFTDYYPDSDGDGYGAGSAAAQRSCIPVGGKVTNNQDCDDTRAGVHPGAPETCNAQDDDCDSQTDEGLTFLSYYPDGDGDGFGSSSAAPVSACAVPAGKVTDRTDCDDVTSYVHPGAVELCNTRDDNCDGLVDNGVVTQSYYPDVDGDGYGAQGSAAQPSCSPVAGKVANNTDCNDNNSSIRPGAAETCNGADDNCNAQTDEGLTFLSYYPDLDSDGYGASGSVAQSSCRAVTGKVTNNTDCNDGNTQIRPGVAETCNGVDDNCNAQTDEGLTFVSYYPDADSDTYGSSTAAAQSACSPVAGMLTSRTDCNDGVASIHPGAAEACNSADDDCDGTTDEGNPGGGATCNTGQAGVCQAGTVTCQGGALSCLRNLSPSAELCDNLDNDCNNQVDETFANKGLACTAGVGVCQRSGSYVCTADKTATVCNAVAGPPTAASCDALDNDCDGTVDEPYLSSTSNLGTTAWQDLELTPYYYSAGSCAGGVNGTGTDALAGGAMAMSVGSGGILLQRLDTNGNPLGSTSSATSLTYSDVAIAQAGDGYLIAGIWSASPEIDIYYLDSAGTSRVYLYSQFKPGTGNSIDSLRMVRGNGKRVSLVWREVINGATPATRLLLARMEPWWDGVSWSIRNAGGAASPITSTALPVAATVMAGVGADSTHQDWVATQTCPSAATLRPMAVAYLTSASSLNYFTMNEDGSAKGVETVVRTTSGTQTLAEPEVAFFRSAAADHWFVGYVTPDTGATAQSDLDYWLTTSPSWHYAYLQYATENGAASIRRPRATVSSTRILFTALRYVVDASAFKRQVMTRKIDFTGAKDPGSSSVELSATQGACGTDPACRPGDKDGLANWAAKDKLYYSGSGGTPAGAFASSLTCQ
ncbi:MAG: putative metal-binding motif-containing protein, partial [Myxococcaceae bacterium]